MKCGRFNSVWEMLRTWQCDACRQGKRCKCTRKDAKAFIEYPNKKRRYFCHMGCLLLHLPLKERRSVIVRQFNVEGHYEKMAS